MPQGKREYLRKGAIKGATPLPRRNSRSVSFRAVAKIEPLKPIAEEPVAKEEAPKPKRESVPMPRKQSVEPKVEPKKPAVKLPKPKNLKPPKLKIDPKPVKVPVKRERTPPPQIKRPKPTVQKPVLQYKKENEIFRSRSTERAKTARVKPEPAPKRVILPRAAVVPSHKVPFAKKRGISLPKIKTQYPPLLQRDKTAT